MHRRMIVLCFLPAGKKAFGRAETVTLLHVRAVRLDAHLLDAAVSLHPGRLVATGVARIADAQPVGGCAGTGWTWLFQTRPKRCPRDGTGTDGGTVRYGRDGGVDRLHAPVHAGRVRSSRGISHCDSIRVVRRRLPEAGVVVGTGGSSSSSVASGI